MLKERNQTFKLLFGGLDIIIALVSCTIAFVYRYYVQDSTQFLVQFIDIPSYVVLGLVLSITQVLSFISIDLYHPRRGLSFFSEISTILKGVLLNLLVILAFVFFFRGESFSRLVILYFTAINILLTSISHFYLRLFLKKLREKGYNLRKVLIIGTEKPARKITEILQKHQIFGYKISGYVNVHEIESSQEYPIIGNIDSIERIIEKEKPDLVVYALSMSEGDYFAKVLNACDYEGIEIKVVPGYTEFITARGRVEDMDGIPVITIRNIPVRLGYNKFLKRAFDFSFAFLFVLVFSPMYTLVALLIKLTSRGPVFFKQERVGLDNKKFDMLKFRTMYVQDKSKSETVWTTKNDPRVTPIGRILRKLSIDEIPQFFNVLLGDMSVVGPRPERPFYVDKFKTEYIQYMRRHSVKAGITGWAQINGLRGDTSIEDRIQADIYYIENWSFWFDLKIILMTPLKGVLDKNAY